MSTSSKSPDRDTENWNMISIADQIAHVEAHILERKEVLRKLKAEQERERKSHFEYRNDTVLVSYRKLPKHKESCTSKVSYVRNDVSHVDYTKDLALSSILDELEEIRTGIDAAIGFVREQFDEI